MTYDLIVMTFWKIIMLNLKENCLCKAKINTRKNKYNDNMVLKNSQLIYVNDHVLTMVDHGQNTVNLGHGQTVAYG